MLYSDCRAYKKVASLAANQKALPESSAQLAAAADGHAGQAGGHAGQASGSNPGSSSSAGGLVMQLQSSQEPQKAERPLHTSLFQGAMRCLAAKESQGAEEVQVSCCSG